jgi:deoxyribodipyrimidine photo-lyase
MKGLVWFREDLRIHDHTALYHASKECDGGLLGLYIIDPHAWRQHQMARCRIQFLLAGLQELSETLQKRGIPLHIEIVKNTREVPHKISALMKKYQLKKLFFNRQYEVNEQNRDQAVVDQWVQQDYFWESYDDTVILAPGTVLTKSGEPFVVFTPFKKAWQNQFMRAGLSATYPLPKKQRNEGSFPAHRVPVFDEFSSPIQWPAGENEARRRLKYFLAHHLTHYHQQRDFPALTATSQLSPYLSAGMISPRQCFLAALAYNQGRMDGGDPGALAWMNELIWREFYKHLLVAFPRLSKHQPYRLETDQLPWRSDQKAFLAWTQGKTGYPFVDAGMRQLAQTGWMHNRLRMVTAMYLTKNLFLDWRLGETYFIQHLIDGDLAANNGGWQWSASTGTDAVPYFRVFNPVLQSERFDPQGIFIRRYCPELQALDNWAIHDPHHRAPLLVRQGVYPAPTVDLAMSRRKAIAEFKKLSAHKK